MRPSCVIAAMMRSMPTVVPTAGNLSPGVEADEVVVSAAAREAADVRVVGQDGLEYRAGVVVHSTCQRVVKNPVFVINAQCLKRVVNLPNLGNSFFKFFANFFGTFCVHSSISYKWLAQVFQKLYFGIGVFFCITCNPY